jgi:ABC-type xylose transport system permease subunit
LAKIGSKSLFMMPKYDGFAMSFKVLILLFLMLALEWRNRTRRHALERNPSLNYNPLDLLLYVAIICLIYFFNTSSQTFIYFQF